MFFAQDRVGGKVRKLNHENVALRAVRDGLEADAHDAKAKMASALELVNAVEDRLGAKKGEAAALRAELDAATAALAAAGAAAARALAQNPAQREGVVLHAAAAAAHPAHPAAAKCVVCAARGEIAPAAQGAHLALKGLKIKNGHAT